MDMKIKDKDNKVTFVMRAGKQFVQNTIPLSSAEQIIKSGKVVKDEQVAALSNAMFRCVDDKYFFPLEEVPAKKTKVKKEDAE